MRRCEAGRKKVDAESGVRLICFKDNNSDNHLTHVVFKNKTTKSWDK